MVEMEEGVKDRCSLGPHQSMIIPPASVTLTHEGWRGRRRCHYTYEHKKITSSLLFFPCFFSPSLPPHSPSLLDRLVVKEIVPPAISEWRPLVVMANPRSGGNDGPKVLSTFRKLLNPIQVYTYSGVRATNHRGFTDFSLSLSLEVVDLSETPPEAGLEICRLLPHHTCRLLVCGGDGTVGWVLSSLDRCQLTVSVPS